MRNLAAACVLLLASATGPAIAQTAALSAIDLAYRQRVEERLAALDRQLRDMTGVIERLQHQQRQSDAKIRGMQGQIKTLKEKQGGPPPAPASTQPSQAPGESQPSQTLPTGAPQEAYDAAYGLLGQRKFAAGEKAFRTFTAQYPDHTLAANARYWIGETLYARQRYQESATAFLGAWQADTKGPKAPDNLLKLGMSMLQLEKKTEACASFSKLLSDYRGAPARVRTAASRESKSLGCS
jgi:tol-pal system protein YbgF